MQMLNITPSARACRIRKPREEILGESVFKFVASREEAEHIIRQVLANGGWIGESSGRNKEGEIVHVELIASLVTNEDSDPVGLFCFFVDISERKQAEEQLRVKEQELERKARHLEEVNTALKVLLRQRESDREEVEDKILANVKDLILPYIHELSETRLNGRQRAYLDVVRANLESIISPFAKKLTGRSLGLTPAQIKVAELIRSGKTS